MKIFVWTVIIIVAVSIIAGFFVVGSPQTERLRRFDERRVSDLQNIQWQIVNFWQSHERLPDSLDELRDDISGWSAPQDPQTASSYEYIKGGGLNFQICAEFSLENDLTSQEALRFPAPIGKTETWKHGAGKHCFERTIDPALYPPRGKM